MLDRGANRGILGNDAKIIREYDNKVDAISINQHILQELPIVDGAAVIETNKGPIIAVFRQYAYHGMFNTIHSTLQLEQHHNHVNDTPIKLGGTQRLTTSSGYTIPLDISQGLPYMQM